jgi:hypothetical protein
VVDHPAPSPLPDLNMPKKSDPLSSS